MINIGIYSGGAEQKKYIKNSMMQYFKDFNIEARISYIRTKSLALKNMITRFREFNIIIICEENKITYVKRNVVLNVRNCRNQILGWLDMPLTNEKIDEIILNEDCNGCPPGVYELISKKTIRAINHEDIEYCRHINGKTVFFLKNNEIEEIYKNINIIKNELAEEYFVNCSQGYIVNLFNIKKIDRVKYKLILKSGYEVPISKNKYRNVVSTFIKVIFGM